MDRGGYGSDIPNECSMTISLGYSLSPPTLLSLGGGGMLEDVKQMSVGFGVI